MLAFQKSRFAYLYQSTASLSFYFDDDHSLDLFASEQLDFQAFTVFAMFLG